MEQLGYSASRKTQENIDFHEYLGRALDNGITPDEAKVLVEKYEAIRDTKIEGKKQILAIDRDKLTELSNSLGKANGNLPSTIKHLYDIASNASTNKADTGTQVEITSEVVIPRKEEIAVMVNEDNLKLDEVLPSFDRSQREYLQVIVGAYPDGIVGEGTKSSLNTFLEKNSLTLKQLIDKYEIATFHLDYDYDKKMPRGNLVEVRENFNNKYSVLNNHLETTLGLPSGINNALARKESFYFTDLNSGSGSKGGMQLTKWPFQDMRGFGAKADTFNDMIRVRNTKIGKYQEIFQMIDFNTIKTLSAGDNKTIGETLPTEIWSKLESIGTSTPEQAEIIFAQLQGILKSKSNSKNYLHTLNIILGDVYFKYLYQHEAGNDTKKAAKKYNNDPKGAVDRYNKPILKSDGTQWIVRDYYAKKVVDDYLISESK